MNADPPLPIAYYSDILCVWAYFAEIRIAELRKRFGEKITLQHGFIPVFGDTARKIGEGWKEKGGYEGFNHHLHAVARPFTHVAVHSDLWTKVRPASSAPAHLFLKAVQLWEQDETGRCAPEGALERMAWALRLAFFRDGRDIATRAVQEEIAAGLSLPLPAIGRLIESGRAFAALCADAEDQHRLKIEGSPTFILNQGRQKLYGNVGYKVIEAVVQELLTSPNASRASWC